MVRCTLGTKGILTDFQIGDIVCIVGDKRRIGLIIEEEVYTAMFLVQFFDPIFKDAWYHDDMLKKVK